MSSQPPSPILNKVVIAKDRTYAVEIRSAKGAPLTISGFETEDEARSWLESRDAWSKPQEFAVGDGD